MPATSPLEALVLLLQLTNLLRRIVACKQVEELRQDLLPALTFLLRRAQGKVALPDYGTTNGFGNRAFVARSELPRGAPCVFVEEK